jgi:hypothetical protein
VLARPWPALGALAATAVLVIVVARLLPFGGTGGEIQFRGAPTALKVEIIADGVIARARPGDDQPAVAALSRGTVAKRLEESGEWTRIELPDGRRVWVRSARVVLIHTESR